MDKMLRVLRYELKTSLSRPSFYILSFGVPAAILIAFTVWRLLGGGAAPQTESSPLADLEPEGYVDQAGVIHSLPPDLPTGMLVAFTSEAEATQALEKGDIAAFYIIPADHLKSGRLDYMCTDCGPFSSDDQEWLIQSALLYNLLEGNTPLVQRIWQPAIVTVTDLSNPAGNLNAQCPMPGYSCETNLFLYYLPMYMMVAFFIAVLTTASLLLQNMSKEKENRLIEVLISSMSTNQLLIGKILGLGTLGLLQVTAWLGAAYFIINGSGSAINIPAGYSLPGSLFAWGLIFFVLGYFVYGFLMAAAGAMVPDAKSYTSTAMLVSSPMYIGYMILLFRGYSPHDVLTTALSLFPLTSPVAMVWRLVHGNVPVWQILLAVVLLAATGIFVALTVGRMFRAQLLLSGQPFSMRRYLRCLWKPELAA